VLDLESVRVEVLEPSLPRLADPGVPAVDAAVGPLRVLDPFDLGVAALLDEVGEGGDEGLLVERLGPREEVGEEIDVLLRHRRT
jgi:hypothetical protein